MFPAKGGNIILHIDRLGIFLMEYVRGIAFIWQLNRLNYQIIASLDLSMTSAAFSLPQIMSQGIQAQSIHHCPAIVSYVAVNTYIV